MWKESEEIELKKSLSQLKEGIISLSAMLNKNNHGDVYFGINDDGRGQLLTLPTKSKTTSSRFLIVSKLKMRWQMVRKSFMPQ